MKPALLLACCLVVFIVYSQQIPDSPFSFVPKSPANPKKNGRVAYPDRCQILVANTTAPQNTTWCDGLRDWIDNNAPLRGYISSVSRLS